MTNIRERFGFVYAVDKNMLKKWIRHENTTFNQCLLRKSLSLTILRILSYALTAFFKVATFCDMETLKKYHREYNPFKQLFVKRMNSRYFTPKWFRETFTKDCGDYYDFCGVTIPKMTNPLDMHTLDVITPDTFFLHLCRKPYTRENVDVADTVCDEGGYLMDEPDCPMMIRKGDVVIDAGAWAGDFSALAANAFGAVCYAFEPEPGNFKILKRTSELNTNGKIIPVPFGLGSENGHAKMSLHDVDSGSNIVSEDGDVEVRITTLDDYVKKNKIEKINFIKADIEGFEREMLKGAQDTMRRFRPKLSLCTYHLPDDPVVLKQLILQACSDYKFEQRKKKLFAWCE